MPDICSKALIKERVFGSQNLQTLEPSDHLDYSTSPKRHLVHSGSRRPHEPPVQVSSRDSRSDPKVAPRVGSLPLITKTIIFIGSCYEALEIEFRSNLQKMLVLVVEGR